MPNETWAGREECPDTGYLNQEFIHAVYRTLDPSRDKTVDQICVELGTEDDFAVLGAISLLGWNRKACHGKDKYVYGPDGCAIILSTYRRFIQPSPIRKTRPELMKKIYDTVPKLSGGKTNVLEICEEFLEEDVLDVLGALQQLENECKIYPQPPIVSSHLKGPCLLKNISDGKRQ